MYERHWFEVVVAKTRPATTAYSITYPHDPHLVHTYSCGKPEYREPPPAPPYIPHYQEVFMKAIQLVLLIVSLLAAADLANIDFTSNGWIVDNGVTISNDTLTITGDKGSYRKARLTVAVPSTTEELYLSARVKLSTIDGGPESYKTAKFKILNGADGKSVQAFNMPDLITDRWYTTGMKVERFNKKGITSVILEFSIQNAAGTMEVTTPKLTDTPPASSYSFPFDTPADPSCNIELATDNIRPFPDHLLSINSHFVWANGDWGSESVRSILKDRLPLGNLRFPGGTVGNFYNWQTDGFFGDDWTFLSASRKSAYENGFTFGFNDFASLCKETGATATLMFNVIHDDPSTAAARLANRIGAGIDIDWIELGNENFFTEQSFGNIDTPEKYIAHTKAVTSALKTIDPSIRTAVNLDHHDWGTGSWNLLLAAESYYDAAIIHPYVSTNTFMVNEYAAKMMLSSYRITNERLDEYRTHFPNTPLLCTEWSVLSEGSPSNFLQALGVADLFLALLEGNDSGTVQQMGIHMLYHSDKYSEATCYFGENGEMKRTRLGVIYEELVNLFSGSDLYTASGFSADLEEHLPGVIARAVQDGDTTKILVVNKLPVASPLQVTMDKAAFTGNFTMKWFTESITGDSTGYALTDDPWHSSTGTGTPSVPPYSIAVVTLDPGGTSVESQPVQHKMNYTLNKVGSTLTLTLPAEGTVKLFTLNGKEIRHRDHFTAGEIGRSLPRGIYMLQVNIEGNTMVQRLAL